MISHGQYQAQIKMPLDAIELTYNVDSPKYINTGKPAVNHMQVAEWTFKSSSGSYLIVSRVKPLWLLKPPVAMAKRWK